MIKNHFEKSGILIQLPAKKLRILEKFFETKTKTIGKQYLRQNPDETWEIRGRISDKTLQDIKETVKLSQNAVLVLQDEIELARNAKEKLSESVESDIFELDLEESVILALEEQRTPGFYEKIEPIEYYTSEKENIESVRILHIKRYVQILTRIKKKKNEIRFVKELVKCNKFLLELTGECKKQAKAVKNNSEISFSEISDILENSTQLYNQTTDIKIKSKGKGLEGKYDCSTRVLIDGSGIWAREKRSKLSCGDSSRVLVDKETNVVKRSSSQDVDLENTLTEAEDFINAQQYYEEIF